MITRAHLPDWVELFQTYGWVLSSESVKNRYGIHEYYVDTMQRQAKYISLKYSKPYLSWSGGWISTESSASALRIADAIAKEKGDWLN